MVSVLDTDTGKASSNVAFKNKEYSDMCYRIESKPVRERPKKDKEEEEEEEKKKKKKVKNVVHTQVACESIKK
jgi:hypothetical protein